MPHKRLHSIFWHLFLNSTKTLAHRMLCFVFVFFLSSISAIPQLLETCCVFEFLKLPPVMKITLIACLWNIQSETEYAVTITSRWRLTFYIPWYSISSFLAFFFFFETRISFEVLWSQLHHTPAERPHHGQKKDLFPLKQHSTTIYWAPIMCHTLV